ncbi:hypothetical protein OSB04_012730 [Centaurea solstitialis]|uniref:Protein kinase domain-containing protein n=1 Tax=Centaurea solstitialis TaxID=347529 RepID=A0AA38TMJ2_9ASTR|nr:hypothetical protein OSB04_012730 [Centaurea solstitialis]
MSGLRESQHLKRQLHEIQLATNKFQTCIGKGGYGLVYKGQLNISGTLTTVAVKRLNEQFGQGLKEFLTEIQLLTGQNHPNLISLLGYCDEGKEKIIVYEYAERGSLDKYLMSSNTDYTPLTWLERLRICIDAGKGLDHLHNHAGIHQTIIHRDIKSANILLDENSVAKISDFGLSKLSLAGLNRSAVISHPCGTPGYCEPESFITGIVKKESDVYSFGMVLFEVLCGRLCSFQHEDGLLLSARLAKDYYEKEKLIEIIDPLVREEMSLESMNKFSAIAYRCLQDDRGGRPAIDLVVEELIESLNLQVKYELEKEKKLKQHHARIELDDSDEYWKTKLPRGWQVIIKMLNIPPTIYVIKKELCYFLRKGILFDENNKFFWINNDGKICIWISATRFIQVDKAINDSWGFQHGSRFSMVAKYSLQKRREIKCQIKVSMLSLGIMYAASLVFRDGYGDGPFSNSKRFQLTTIKWKTQELSVYSTHTAEVIKEDEQTPKSRYWYKIKMWHFITHVPNTHFDIVIDEISVPEYGDTTFLIQGIEFQPLEMMQQEDIGGLKTSDEKGIDEDAYWEKKLPNDYQHYVYMSNNYLHYTTKKKLYFLFCAGFLGYSGKLWFSLCKSTSGICSMLSASEILSHDYQNFNTLSLPESRFSEVKQLRGADEYRFTCKLRSPMFSPHHVYACYLVFKFADNNIQLDDTRKSTVNYWLDGVFQLIKFLNFNFLPPMNIPTVEQKSDYGLHDSRIEELEMPDFRICQTKDCWMQQREDGWMEVILCKPLHNLENRKSLQVTFKYRYPHGIIVEGIEFRPMQVYG